MVHIADDLTLYPFFTLQNKNHDVTKINAKSRDVWVILLYQYPSFIYSPWEKIMTVTKWEPAFLQCHSNPNTVIYILAGRTWCSNLVPIWKNVIRFFCYSCQTIRHWVLYNRGRRTCGGGIISTASSNSFSFPFNFSNSSTFSVLNPLCSVFFFYNIFPCHPHNPHLC